jgi:single-strand DNA-binding protein
MNSRLTALPVREVKVKYKQIKRKKMMNIKNHVQLIGRLGAHPEVKILENGTKVARFSIAVSNTYKNRSGERVTDVQWHNIVAWGTLAALAEKILQKGTQVTIDGKLLNRSYVNKQGEKRSNTEIVASEFFVAYQKAA